jgi:hypothetical protein
VARADCTQTGRQRDRPFHGSDRRPVWIPAAYRYLATTPSPASTIFLTSKKALKGQSTKSSSSSTTWTTLFQVGYTTTCIDFLVYRLCRRRLLFNPARLQVIRSSRIQAQQCICSFQTYLPAGVWDKVF